MLSVIFSFMGFMAVLMIVGEIILHKSMNIDKEIDDWEEDVNKEFTKYKRQQHNEIVKKYIKKH